MSLREELGKAREAATLYEVHGVMPAWAKMAMVDFLRDHGQALLEAVADSDRMNQLELSKRADVAYQGDGEPVLIGYEWGCGGEYSTARDALDAAIAARSKTVDGGGVLEGIQKHRGNPENPPST